MFEFTNDCLIGHEELDQDHKKMFELLNKGIYVLQDEFIEDKYDNIKEIFDELLDYSNTHFAREEGYMMKIRDAELIMQRVQHNHFRNELWKLVGKSIDEFDEQIEVLSETMNFLTEWLYHHIIGSDALIGKLEPLDEWMVKENPCEFSDEYMTNIPMIDGEHKTLFEITGRVYDILKDGATEEDADTIIEVLKELRQYTAEHFSDEEDYMRSVNYDGLDAQIRAHRTFIAELDGLDEDEIRKNTQEYVRSLLEFLLGWLINHILKVDMQITKM